MNVIQKSMIVLACGLFSACANSGTAQQTQTSAAASATSDKKVCRSFSELGSHMKKSVCRTQAEWDRIGRKGGDDMDALIDGPSSVEIPTVGQ